MLDKISHILTYSKHTYLIPTSQPFSRFHFVFSSSHSLLRPLSLSLPFPLLPLLRFLFVFSYHILILFRSLSVFNFFSILLFFRSILFSFRSVFLHSYVPLPHPFHPSSTSSFFSYHFSTSFSLLHSHYFILTTSFYLFHSHYFILSFSLSRLSNISFVFELDKI